MSRDRLAAAGGEDDRRWCAALLPRVSRTFALSIEALPETLREAVRLAYLLCRVVDTVEDALPQRLAADERAALFEGFDRLVGDDGMDPAPFEARCAAAELGEGAAERELVRRAGAVLRPFRALPVAQREAIRPPVLRMSQGMRQYAGREAAAGLVDMADLERYCYFVAGTVGELLTALFLQQVPLADEPRAALAERAVSFGIGLQLVNIVKDVAADHQRGACYLPQRLAEQSGVTLAQVLHPTQRPAALAVVRAVCARARTHLARASQYTELWPLPEGRAVRLFCAVPLALAYATLGAVEAGNETLRPGREPKIDRLTVLRIVSDAQQAAASDGALRALLHRCGAGAPTCGG